MNKQIGITTTVPIEVVYAAGYRACDLNNAFVTDSDPSRHILYAEENGFPRNMCAWIKGLYATIKQRDIREIIAVVQGDCSNAISLSERVETEGVSIIPFSYPYDGDSYLLKREIEKLMKYFNVSWEDVAQTKRKLDRIRSKVKKIDELTWRIGSVSGFENHIWQISCSDFNGDPDTFERELDEFYKVVSKRTVSAEPMDKLIRIGVIGVPPIVSDLYQYIEQSGAKVVFNEMQRQCAMPYVAADVVQQYMLYTYPYGIKKKIADIEGEIKKRNIDGIIHYVQSFCHHHAEHEIFKKELSVPILALECDKPGKLDGKEKLRIDTFTKSLSIKRGSTHLPKKSASNISGSITKSGKIKEKLTCGVDIGSRNTKIIYVQNEKIAKEQIFDTVDFYKCFGKHGEDSFSIDMSLFPERPGKIISTGYGRGNIGASGKNSISEIYAHIYGARYSTGHESFILVDIGGQDVKVASVKEGLVKDFIVNDKCAAGTGRYLENMSKILGISIDDLGMQYDSPEYLNATCAVFSETEVIGKINSGLSKEIIASSVNYSAFLRIKLYILKFLDGETPVLFTGGGARNIAIQHFAQEELGVSIVKIDRPQFAGALGCAWYGANVT
ncbi:MAG: acyl-CoA dehydratase activase [Candidatus Ancaeobacter aquaticus]|nr:acyl-CoA dehydratase activase [Candidatus Ancaeobacter aquaticus]